MTTWMIQLQESDRDLVEVAQEYSKSSTYNGTVREAVLHYIKTQGGDAPDAL